MGKPTKHRLIVEVTDMTGAWSTRSARSQVEHALISSVFINFENIQVKNAARVEAAAKVGQPKLPPGEPIVSIVDHRGKILVATAHAIFDITDPANIVPVTTSAVLKQIADGHEYHVTPVKKA